MTFRVGELGMTFRVDELGITFRVGELGNTFRVDGGNPTIISLVATYRISSNKDSPSVDLMS